MFLLVLIINLLCRCGVYASIIIAVKSNDGIVFATDGLSTGGVLVDNRSVKKSFRLNSNTVLCCASGQNQFVRLCEDIKNECLRFQHSDAKVMGTRSVAYMCRQLAYNKYSSVHVIIAGCEDIADKDTTWSIHEILPGGSLIQQNYAVAGSGANVVVPLLDEFLYLESDTPSVENQHTITKTLPVKNSNKIIWKSEIHKNSDYRSTNTFLAETNPSSLTTSRAKHEPKLPSTMHAIAAARRALRSAISLDPRSGGISNVWSFTTSQDLHRIS